MSYTKNTWETGDVVTAAKLNNMENGIADVSDHVIFTIAQDTVTCNKTAAELANCFDANGIPKATVFARITYEDKVKEVVVLNVLTEAIEISGGAGRRSFTFSAYALYGGGDTFELIFVVDQSGSGFTLTVVDKQLQ